MLCLFSDGMGGSARTADGVIVSTGLDGTTVPVEPEQRRPAAEIVGWRVACFCTSRGRTGAWLGPKWERADVEDIEQRRLAVPDDLAADLAYDEGPRGALLLTEWEREHLGSANPELTTVRYAAAAAHAARRQLDQAVTAAREQGASWADIGTAAGVSRQAAHERWSR